MTTTIAAQRVRKSKKTKVVEEVPVVEEEPVVEESSQEESSQEEPSLEQRLDHFREVLSSEIKFISEKMKTLKGLDQEFKRISVDVKKHIKRKSKKVRATGSSNHGFNAPGLITDELADFLGMERGSLLRRPQVGSLISKYANENGLKDASNGSIFLPDKSLKKILGPAVFPIKKESDVNGYSIFNLQKYLKRHFIKVDA